MTISILYQYNFVLLWYRILVASERSGWCSYLSIYIQKQLVMLVFVLSFHLISQNPNRAYSYITLQALYQTWLFTESSILLVCYKEKKLINNRQNIAFQFTSIIRVFRMIYWLTSNSFVWLFISVDFEQMIWYSTLLILFLIIKLTYAPSHYTPGNFISVTSVAFTYHNISIERLPTSRHKNLNWRHAHTIVTIGNRMVCFRDADKRQTKRAYSIKQTFKIRQ